MKKTALFFFASFILILFSAHFGVANAVGRPLIVQGISGGGRLKACQAREESIKNRMSHITQLATGMETKFSTIAARAEDYLCK